ncbi:MAG: (2Fe-2S)-binding protein [Rhodospirillaceae bacterium]|nr:(2Fe-2S)-binding protein [Rhodospirillaceae bacterium]
MYVCICNALRDKDVEQAVAAGARTVFDVYGFHGCEPQCGRCMPTMQTFLGGAAPANDMCPLFDDDLLAAE